MKENHHHHHQKGQYVFMSIKSSIKNGVMAVKTRIGTSISEK
jgi:hypothetical protein